MTSDNQKQIGAIVRAALEHAPGADRERFLDDACGGDAALRREAAALVENSPAVAPDGDEVGPQTYLPPAGADEMPAMIDVYEIKGELGRGGMGAVYLAERADGEFRQRVALKVIKRGMDTDFIIRRFRHERQVLASLNHPNVARLIGGGSEASGLPYFVMEFVDGEPLYEFCDSREYDVPRRLQLFLEICDAVEAVHRLQVVHRDLKPSNVLVAANGRPKLLDFGIAKLLDPEMASSTLEPTATAMRLMTPEYAAPEQVRGEAVTPATDVYSLGVVLFELLTGHRPYVLSSRAPYEIQRAVCEQPPVAPSIAAVQRRGLISKAGDAYDVVFRQRSTDPGSLARSLAGSLDRVVLKALRKKPSERYQSVAELAADLKLALEGSPVNAEPFTTDGGLERESFQPDSKTCVAILPFKAFAAGADTGGESEFLRIGLADALVTRLSVIRNIIVRPTSSALAFAGASVDPFHAGQALGVDFVIDGNLRRAGSRLRVTVQLLSVADRSTLWAQSFDEEVTDILDLEDSISTRIGSSLAPQLAGDDLRRFERRGTNHAGAYQAYLEGRYYANLFSGDSLVRSLECFEEAARLDPEYALAHVGIAGFHVWSAVFGQVPARDGFAAAKREITRALELDDSLGEAYAIDAFIALLFDWDWAAAERLVMRALELNPNFGFAHECYSNVLSTQGRFDEAVRAILRAETLDPLSPRAKLMSSWTLYIARRFPEAIAKALAADAMLTDSAMALVHLGYARCQSGEVASAIRDLSRAAQLWPGNAMPRFMLCFALAAEGRADEAAAVRDEIDALAASSHVKPYFRAMARVATGDVDGAFEWFARSVEARDEWLIWFGADANLDAMATDPRYLEILRLTNNPIAGS